MDDLFLPVCFAEVLEVVHVAACGGVLSVLVLPLLCVSDLQQVSVVFHNVITFQETARGEHGPPLSFYVLNLKTTRSLQSHTFRTANMILICHKHHISSGCAVCFEDVTFKMLTNYKNDFFS